MGKLKKLSDKTLELLNNDLFIDKKGRLVKAETAPGGTIKKLEVIEDLGIKIRKDFSYHIADGHVIETFRGLHLVKDPMGNNATSAKPAKKKPAKKPAKKTKKR